MPQALATGVMDSYMSSGATGFDSKTYEHIKPELVGNQRRVLVSNQAGKSNILSELERLGIPTERGDERITKLLEEVKAREATGYAYEGADASFELLARRLLGWARSARIHVTVGKSGTWGGGKTLAEVEYSGRFAPAQLADTAPAACKP